MSWQEFRAAKKPFAIAIDGYVNDRPAHDLTGPYANFNHHERVSRLETRATCAQILMAIRMGLFKVFRDAEGPRADVYANDCDEDICISWFLLSHSHIAESVINPTLNRLVNVGEIMDTTAGTYPLSIDTPILHQLAWIMEPYRKFRLGGGLEHRDPSAFSDIVVNVGQRIEQYMIGNGKSIALDTRYERIGGGPGWALIHETGSYGRQGAFSDGIRAFVSARERGDGKWTYSIGRASEFIPFDVPKLIALLNQHEKGPDRWGGGTTISGSPRTTGSGLSPKEVEKIINEEMMKRII